MKKKSSKPTLKSTQLRRGVSQNYALKAAVEQLFGQQAWLDLKETTCLATWRQYALKIIDAIEISIHVSIEVRDEDWISNINENLNHGRALVKSAENLEELLSSLTAVLLRQVFLQIGLCPNRQTALKVTLRAENWKLNDHRSVQYIQSPAQVEAAFWSKQQKQIGFAKQMVLRDEYKVSKSKLPFSRWCREREG
jgi:hypothetical protein